MKQKRKILKRLFRAESLVHSKFSKTNLVIFGVLFSLVGSYALYTSFAATPTTANLWVDTNGGSCTRQATAGAYIDAQACSTFDAAWDAATAGDTIVVKVGTYGHQCITGDKTSVTKIIGENGVVVQNDGIECYPVFGGDSALGLSAAYMWLENVTLDSQNNPSIGGSARIWNAHLP